MSNDLNDARRIKNEIQRLLLQNRAHNYIGKQSKGKLLDLNNHVGLLTGSSAIRKRKLLNDQSEYELCLLLDLSGSIFSSASGPNPLKKEEKDRVCGLYNMITYAYSLLQVFIPILGENNVHIYGFNRDFVNLKYLFLKRKMTNQLDKATIDYIYSEVYIWSNYNSRNGGNHDGYALTQAVISTPWKDDVDVSNRIVVHFSDGLPACGGCVFPGCFQKDSELIRNLNNSIKQIETSGYVLVGVGINDEGVQRFYKKLNVVAKNALEMYEGTLKILKQQIKRGNFK